MNALKPLLLFACLLMTSSCGSVSTKPSSEPKAPLIDCKERRAHDAWPAAPGGTDWRLWAAWGAALLGVGQQGDDYRADTAECLDAHRKAGDIR